MEEQCVQKSGGEPVQKSGEAVPLGGDGREGRIIPFSERYKEVAFNCFKYLGFRSFEEVDQLTVAEYNLLMDAVFEKLIDRQEEIHSLAWLTAVKASAKKQVGKKKKIVYIRFRDFFNRQKVENRIKNKTKTLSRKGRSADG